MKRIIRSYPLFLVITAIYGLVFGIISNLFFDRLVAALWSPLAITILFVCFLLPLLLIVFLVAKYNGTHEKMEHPVANFAAGLALFLVAVLGLEFLYELGLKTTVQNVDSYVFVIDDSGSMTGSDPNKMRVSSIEKILADKDGDFQYAIYSFSDTYTQIRPMLPKRHSTAQPQMESSGGTSIYGTLCGILDDVDAGRLKVTGNTRLLFLSDGAATDMSGYFNSSLRDVLRRYVEKSLVISTVGLGRGADAATLKRIANSTGGVFISAEDADQLTGAMVEASVQSADRTLLTIRFFCKTEALHAVMRIVFLLIISVILQLLKIEVYGKYYKPQLAFGSVCSVLAALVTEVLMEHTLLGENVCRIVFWILLALMIIEHLVNLREKIPTTEDLSEVPVEPSEPEDKKLDRQRKRRKKDEIKELKY